MISPWQRRDDVPLCKGCGDRRHFSGDLCVWCRPRIQNETPAKKKSKE